MKHDIHIYIHMITYSYLKSSIHILDISWITLMSFHATFLFLVPSKTDILRLCEASGRCFAHSEGLVLWCQVSYLTMLWGGEFLDASCREIITQESRSSRYCRDKLWRLISFLYHVDRLMECANMDAHSLILRFLLIYFVKSQDHSSFVAFKISCTMMASSSPPVSPHLLLAQEH